jgi:hypothetical protein
MPGERELCSPAPCNVLMGAPLLAFLARSGIPLLQQTWDFDFCSAPPALCNGPRGAPLLAFPARSRIPLLQRTWDFDFCSAPPAPCNGPRGPHFSRFLREVGFHYSSRLGILISAARRPRSGQTAHRTFTSSLRTSKRKSPRPRAFRGQSSRHHASRYLSNRARVDRGLNHSAINPSAISTGITYHKSSGTI